MPSDSSQNSNLLTKVQAIQLLGLDKKVFENYFRYAQEFQPVDRPNGRGRFFFDKKALEKWKTSYTWRTIMLTRSDYNLCLDFALAMHFRGYVLSDWGQARQREFGQKITNWVKGQLAELAVKKFLKDKFNIEVELDFEIHPEIVPQDIIEVVQAGVKRKPKIGISIKSSKPKNAALVLGENEIVKLDRSSDVYIFCRPALPDDHLLRIGREEVISSIKDQPHYEKYKDKMPTFNDMACEVAGFCYKEDLEKVTEIPGQKFDGIRYVKLSGKLHRSKEDWEELISKL